MRILTVSGMGTVLEHPLNIFNTLLNNYGEVNKRFGNSYTRTNYDRKLRLKLFPEPMDRDSARKMMLKQEEIFKQQVQLHSSAHHSFYFSILNTLYFHTKIQRTSHGISGWGTGVRTGHPTNILAFQSGYLGIFSVPFYKKIKIFSFHGFKTLLSQASQIVTNLNTLFF